MQIEFKSDVFFDFIGRLKLTTVILGLIDLILTGASYVTHDSRDQAFLALVIIFFLLSLAWILAVMFGLLVVEDSHVKFDMIYHVCACISLLISGIFFMISISKHGKSQRKYTMRIFSVIIGFVNSAIYGYLPWKLLKAT